MKNFKKTVVYVVYLSVSYIFLYLFMYSYNIHWICSVYNNLVYKVTIINKLLKILFKLHFLNSVADLVKFGFNMSIDCIRFK